MNSSKLFGRKVLFAAVSVVALGASAVVLAATDTANLSVSADVIDNCTISTGAVAFGNYDPIETNFSGNLDNTGTVTVTCTLNDSVVITLGQGSNAGGGSTDADPARRLLNGVSNYLSYSLFSDSGRSTEWGNTAGTGKATTGLGTAENHTVYGRVDSAQNKPAGNYTDTVVATVTF